MSSLLREFDNHSTAGRTNEARRSNVSPLALRRWWPSMQLTAVLALAPPSLDQAAIGRAPRVVLDANSDIDGRPDRIGVAHLECSKSPLRASCSNRRQRWVSPRPRRAGGGLARGVRSSDLQHRARAAQSPDHVAVVRVLPAFDRPASGSPTASSAVRCVNAETGPLNPEHAPDGFIVHCDGVKCGSSGRSSPARHHDPRTRTAVAFRGITRPSCRRDPELALLPLSTTLECKWSHREWIKLVLLAPRWLRSA